MMDCKIAVSNIEWHNDHNGFLVGKLLFDKTNFFGSEITELVFGTTDKFTKNKIGVGSSLTFKQNPTDKNSVSLKQVDNPGNATTPPSCTSCGAKTSHKTLCSLSGMSCINIFCDAKPTINAYRVCAVSGLPGDLPFSIWYRWFRRFPNETGIESDISDMVSLLMVFKQTGPKNTTKRRDILKNTFDTDLLHELECNLENKLIEGLSFSEFWYIAIPRLNEYQSKKLEKFDPREFTSSQVDELNSVLGNEQSDYIIRTTHKWEKYCNQFNFVTV